MTYEVSKYSHTIIHPIAHSNRIEYTQAQVWSLEQCIDTAQIHNKNLLMNRNNISIGEQKAKEAKANLIPKVTANADYKYFLHLPYQFLPLHLVQQLRKDI